MKFAPIVTAERMNNPTWERPGRTMYWPGSLRFLPIHSEIPLVVDHNLERQVGVVHELFEMDWIDGPWVCARATVSDPPCWLKRYETKASFSRWNIHSTPVGESDRVTSAFVKEVSILSPTTEPREPFACVLSIRPTETPHTTTRTTAAPIARAPVQPVGGEVFYSAPGTVLRRTVGQVLGVR